MGEAGAGAGGGLAGWHRFSVARPPCGQWEHSGAWWGKKAGLLVSWLLVLSLSVLG